MNVIRRPDTAYDSSDLLARGYQVLAAETWTWADGVSETEILWIPGGRAPAISEADLPY